MHDIEILTQQFCDHATYIKGYSPHTIKRYRTLIRVYCRQANVKKVDQITNASIRQFFLYGRVELGWAANTYIVYHKTLAVFFRWCRRQGFMTDDPLAAIEVPKLPKTLPKKLTRREADRLLEVVQNYPYSHEFLRSRNYAIFHTFILAGLRKSELLGLRVIDVDLENLTIFVRQGKGCKDRIVPISYTLAQTLRRYDEQRRRAQKTCPEFFTSINRNCGYTDAGLKRLVKQVKEASGINFHVHRLRHTFATLMLEGGGDIYSLSRMMSHADIKTTTIYLSATAEYLRSQASKHPLN